MEKSTLQQDVEKVSNGMNDIRSRLTVIEGKIDHNSVYSQIDDIFRQISTLTTKLAKIMQKINCFNLDDRYIEVFRDQELKAFYEESNLGILEVKKFLEKYICTDKIIEATAYRYINGELGDLKARSKIGKFLRQAAIEN